MTDTVKIGNVDMVLNPADNGGEAVVIGVDLFDNGDAALGFPTGVFTLGYIVLNSYGNVARMSLPELTPELLRAFADKLELKLVEVQRKQTRKAKANARELRVSPLTPKPPTSSPTITKMPHAGPF